MCARARAHGEEWLYLLLLWVVAVVHASDCDATGDTRCSCLDICTCPQCTGDCQGVFDLSCRTCPVGCKLSGENCVTSDNYYKCGASNCAYGCACSSLSCSSGSYRLGCGGGSQGSCQACDACGADEYRYGCSGLNGGECRACADDCGALSFRQGCTGTSSGSCQSCDTCDAGEYRFGCSGMSEGSCVECGLCGNGYVRTGCGGYSEGTCEAVSCPALGIIANGDENTCDGSTVTTDTCTISCNAGYVVSPYASSQACTGTAEGVASLPNHQTCEGVLCPPLSQPAFGTLGTCDGTTRTGGSCSIVCNSGYQLIGASSLSCDPTGATESAFTGSQSCQAVSCGNLPHPVNGDRGSCTGKTTGEDCQITCDDGYTVVTTPSGTVQTCVGDGPASASYENSQECEAAVCAAIDSVASGSPGTCGASVTSSTCSIVCNNGYVLTPLGSTQQCQGTAPGYSTWGPSQSCPAAVCPDASAPLHGGIGTCTGRTTGQMCSIVCNAGYKVMPTALQTCLPSGVATSSMENSQYCQVAYCLALSPLNGMPGTCDGTKTTGESCSIECNNGYYIVGSTQGCVGSGDTSAHPNTQSCQSCATCDPGTYRSSCAGFDAGICTACATACAGNGTGVFENCDGRGISDTSLCKCAAGSFLSATRVCTLCFSCASGTFRSNCGGLSGGTCEDCECSEGFFSTDTDSTYCFASGGSCAACGVPGSYCAGNNAAREDCTCDPGYYSDSTMSGECSGKGGTCTACGAGRTCAGGTAQPVDCSCSPGTASTGANVTACSCDPLEPGFYALGGALQPRECTCYSGHASNDTAAVACADDGLSCLPCGAGYWSQGRSQQCAGCTCSFGYSSSSVTSSGCDRTGGSCTVCSLGYICAGYEAQEELMGGYCSPLLAPEHGTLSNVCNASLLGVTCGTFACNDGYTLQGSTSRTCLVDGVGTGAGVWSGVEAFCQASPDYCPGFSSPLHGQTSSDCASVGVPSRKIGNTCGPVTCDAGYYVDTNVSLWTCTPYDGSAGVWDAPSPQCLLLPAYCNELMAPTNGYITSPCSASVLGTVCGDFECSPGYARSGSQSRTCTGGDRYPGSGVWSGIAAACSKLVDYCPSLLPPGNGSLAVDCASDGALPRLVHGSCGKFACDRGYELADVWDTRTCLTSTSSAGQWDKTDAECILLEDYCLPLKAPLFGSMTEPCADIRLGDACGTFQCDPGYTLAGPDVRVCSIGGTSSYTGTWSGVETTCTKLDDYCPPLQPPLNGAISTDCVSTGVPTRRIGGMCELISCNDGYEQPVVWSRECVANNTMSGVWAQDASTCELKVDYCLPYEAPANGYIAAGCSNGSDVMLGATCSAFLCNDGYEISNVGVPGVTCSIFSRGRGKWIGMAPQCALKYGYCSSLPPPAHGVTGDDCASPGAEPRRLNGVCSGIACNAGYFLVGAALRVCEAAGSSGAWSGNTSTCERLENYCNPLPPPSRGSFASPCDGGDALMIGAVCGPAACDPGYYLTGSVERTCSAGEHLPRTGVWAGVEATCADEYPFAVWYGPDPSVAVGVAGLVADFMLHVTDSDGLCFNASVAGIVDRPDAYVVVQNTAPCNYSVQLVLNEAATLKIDVTVDGARVPGSPYTVAISPNSAVAANTLIWGTEPRSAGISGISVQPVDAHGNNATAGVVANCSGPYPACALAVSVAAEGHYVLSGLLPFAGVYEVVVFVDGSVANNITVSVMPATTSVSCSPAFCTSDGGFASVVSGNGLRDGQVGMAMHIFIQARDMYQNNRTTNDDVFAVEVADFTLNQVSLATMTSLSDGMYKASFTLVTSDYYDVRIKLTIGSITTVCAAPVTIGIAALCEPGMTAPKDTQNRGVGQCEMCPEDSYSTEINAKFCVDCPAESGTQFLGNARASALRNCTCKRDFYHPSGIPGKACIVCPNGGLCAGGVEPPRPRPGYMVGQSEVDYVFAACSHEDACPGGDGGCGEGYTGYLCQTCDVGYYAQRQFCKPCGASSGGVPVAMIIGAIVAFIIIMVVLVVVQRLIRSGFDTTGITLGITYMQLLGLITNLKLGWPSTTVNLFVLADTLNLDMEFFQPNCASSAQFSFVHTFLISVCSPIAVLILLGVAFLFVKFVIKKSIGDNIIGMVIQLLGFLYISLSKASLSFFDCSLSELDGQYHLDADPQLLCYDPWWNSLRPVGALAIVFYVIGIPAVFAAIVTKNRGNMEDTRVVTRYGSLYRKYRSGAFWFELVTLFRKLTFVGCQMLVNTNVFVLVMVMELVFLSSSVFWSMTAPYANPRYNHMSTFSDLSLMFLLFCGLMFSNQQLPADVRNMVVWMVVLTIPMTLAIMALVVVDDIRKAVVALRGRHSLDDVHLSKVEDDDGELCLSTTAWQGDDDGSESIINECSQYSSGMESIASSNEGPSERLPPLDVNLSPPPAQPPPWRAGTALPAVSPKENSDPSETSVSYEADRSPAPLPRKNVPPNLAHRLPWMKAAGDTAPKSDTPPQDRKPVFQRMNTRDLDAALDDLDNLEKPSNKSKPKAARGAQFPWTKPAVPPRSPHHGEAKDSTDRSIG